MSYINNIKINTFDVFIQGISNGMYPIKIKIYGKDAPIEYMGKTFMISTKTLKGIRKSKVN